MKKMKLLVVGALWATLAVLPAQAQVTVDVAKITCEQYVLYKVTNPKYIAMWLSGYFNAKRDNTVIDTEALEKNAEKVQDYCLRNMKTPVMEAAEIALGIKR